MNDMEKKVYICDICDKQFETCPEGYRSYVGMEIHLKYEDDIDFKRKVRIHICPLCLNEIRLKSRKVSE